jgi:hypothetical protein
LVHDLCLPLNLISSSTLLQTIHPMRAHFILSVSECWLPLLPRYRFRMFPEYLSFPVGREHKPKASCLFNSSPSLSLDFQILSLSCAPLSHTYRFLAVQPRLLGEHRM